ncbi:MAG: GTPase [Dehalococcoidia bacterium]|nr:GTPase [Dehalococcoidia bacterium]
MHDINVGLMLDQVVEYLPETPVVAETDRIRIAIIGRPNVGKSMLLNALVGAERSIVSPVSGTTRDAIDTDIDTPEGQFTIVDTAGIRRPGKLGKGVERHSVTRARGRPSSRCDVAILVIDATEGVTAQDAHIAGIAVEAHKGLVVAANKTDLWEDPEERAGWLSRQMHGRLTFLPWALIASISALEQRGLPNLLDLAARARESRRKRIATGELNTVLRKAIASTRRRMPCTTGA